MAHIAIQRTGYLLSLSNRNKMLLIQNLSKFLLKVHNICIEVVRIKFYQKEFFLISPFKQCSGLYLLFLRPNTLTISFVSTNTISFRFAAEVLEKMDLLRI